MSDYLKKAKVYKGFHYSVLKADMLEYLHKRTLEMLRAVTALLDANDIPYMICGGTLLGAVSTQSFIPWDDDIDVCVFEKDYPRMVDILSQGLQDDMELQWYNTEPNYYHGWAKVRDKRSHVYPDIKAYKNNGVWIDLYKLKCIPRKAVDYLVVQEHFDYLKRRNSIGDITEAEMLKKIEENDLLRRIEQGEKRLRESDDESNVYIIWSASKVIVLEASTTHNFSRKKYIFEGTELYGFDNADQYLRNHYGDDYMSLPSDEQRTVGINYIEYKDTI